MYKKTSMCVLLQLLFQAHQALKLSRCTNAERAVTSSLLCTSFLVSFDILYFVQYSSVSRTSLWGHLRFRAIMRVMNETP